MIDTDQLHHDPLWLHSERGRFTTGDNVYQNGTAGEFAVCYDPSWGRHKARTRPSPGNHDYNTSGAAGYYAYFGAAAGEMEASLAAASRRLTA